MSLLREDTLMFFTATVLSTSQYWLKVKIDSLVDKMRYFSFLLYTMIWLVEKVRM